MEFFCDQFWFCNVMPPEWHWVMPREPLKGHRGTVFSAAFSPDGKRIVTGSGDGTARVWDAATGEQIQALEGPRGRVTARRSAPTANVSSLLSQMTRRRDCGTPRRASKSGSRIC
jgi:hypothetical protein